MENVVTSERSKWAFIIGLLLIVTGFDGKKVISSPNECLPHTAIKDSQLIRTVRG